MNYETHSYRYGLELLQTQHKNLWNELTDVIKNISDTDIINEFATTKKSKKSLSTAINSLLKKRLKAKGWLPEAPLFQDPDYDEGREKVWRLDFAKDVISIEVSFNHGEALAWNLTKPILASELNHVPKAIQTDIGVIILVTEGMKEAGGFDSAVGTYEKAIRYLKPMRNNLTVPLVLIGLKAPISFKINHTKKGNSLIGHVVKIG